MQARVHAPVLYDRALFNIVVEEPFDKTSRTAYLGRSRVRDCAQGSGVSRITPPQTLRPPDAASGPNRDSGKQAIPGVSPNPPKDTDGRREESGRGVRELQGK